MAPASGFLDPSYRSNRPQDIMPQSMSVIVIGVIVPKGAVENLPLGRAEYTNTLLAGTVVLRDMAFRMARTIERKGYRATIVPTEGSEFGYWYADRETLKADVSIKYAGYLAGMGNYGINHLLLLPEVGPRVRMTALVTDAPLVPGSPSGELVEPFCAQCLRCVKVCPAGALHEDGTIEPQKCRDYMFNVLGGLRCGLCVKVCQGRNCQSAEHMNSP
ncbi:MAG: epoxyqueuosine reductase [Methanomassiliicoccales archaeon]|nr:epoxyqueuosine reductase [Methanomassiliicoccales archaeon]